MLIQNSILINGLTPQPVLGLPVALDSLRFLAFKLLNRKIVLKRCRKDALSVARPFSLQNRLDILFIKAAMALGLKRAPNSADSKNRELYT